MVIVNMIKWIIDKLFTKYTACERNNVGYVYIFQFGKIKNIYYHEGNPRYLLFQDLKWKNLNNKEEVLSIDYNIFLTEIISNYISSISLTKPRCGTWHKWMYNTPIKPI